MLRKGNARKNEIDALANPASFVAMPRPVFTELPPTVLLTAENYVQVTAVTIDEERDIFNCDCKSINGGTVSLLGLSKRTTVIIADLAQATLNLSFSTGGRILFDGVVFVHKLDLIDTGLPLGEVVKVTEEEVF